MRGTTVRVLDSPLLPLSYSCYSYTYIANKMPYTLDRLPVSILQLISGVPNIWNGADD